MTELTRKMQLMAGICAAKALVQHLCKRFNDPDSLHVFITYCLDTIHTQILRSRGFDAYMSGVFLYKCIFQVTLKMQRKKKKESGACPAFLKISFPKL